MAVQVTLWCLILGFPLAYMLSRLRGWSRALLYFTILVPLLTSAVVRTFGWMILLSNNGFINKTLISLGLTEAPIPMMYRMTGIVIALVEVLLPLMVLALDAALLNIDRQLYDAARNLGAGATRIFLQITLPLSLPGIMSGSVLVFVLAIQRLRHTGTHRRAAHSSHVNAHPPAGNRASQLALRCRDLFRDAVRPCSSS